MTLKKNLAPAKSLHRAYREEVRKDVKKVAEQGRRAYARVVANWSSGTRPTFTEEVHITLTLALFRIRIQEADKKRPIWYWINMTGTKAHSIKPRKPGGKLVFMAGKYLSKTDLAPARFGGPGVVRDGELRIVASVWHPGFPPRNFSKPINEELTPKFKNGIYNGGRRGLRKAKRGG